MTPEEINDECEKMKQARTVDGDPDGLLWLMSALFKHTLATRAIDYKSNVSIAQPDTFLGIPIVTLIHPNKPWRLVREIS